MRFFRFKPDQNPTEFIFPSKSALYCKPQCVYGLVPIPRRPRFGVFRLRGFSLIFGTSPQLKMILRLTRLSKPASKLRGTRSKLSPTARVTARTPSKAFESKEISGILAALTSIRPMTFPWLSMTLKVLLPVCFLCPLYPMASPPFLAMVFVPSIARHQYPVDHADANAEHFQQRPFVVNHQLPNVETT